MKSNSVNRGGKMNKFNKAQRNVQRERRQKHSQERRLRSGMASLKVSKASTSRTPSGKRLRKLEKKWRIAQKEAIQSGLVTVKDIEMISADDTGAQTSSQKASHGVKLKKHAKLRLRKKVVAKAAKPVQASHPEAMQE